MMGYCPALVRDDMKMLQQPSATAISTTSALGAEPTVGCTGGPVHLKRWSSVQSSEEKPLADPRGCTGGPVHLRRWSLSEAHKRSHSPIEAQEQSCPQNQSSVGSKAGTCVNQSMCRALFFMPFFPTGFLGWSF